MANNLQLVLDLFIGVNINFNLFDDRVDFQQFLVCQSTLVPSSFCFIRDLADILYEIQGSSKISLQIPSAEFHSLPGLDSCFTRCNFSGRVVFSLASTPQIGCPLWDPAPSPRCARSRLESVVHCCSVLAWVYRRG